jgi:hypothetical protein
MGMCIEIVKNEPCGGKRTAFEPILDYWADEEKQTEGILLLHQNWCDKCGIVKEFTTRYKEIEE